MGFGLIRKETAAAATTELMTTEMIDPVTEDAIDPRELAERLLAQAKAQVVSLVGPGGLLSGLTRKVLETALEAELTDHLDHEPGERPWGTNVRNGTRAKTVLTEIGPVEIQVPGSCCGPGARCTAARRSIQTPRRPLVTYIPSDRMRRLAAHVLVVYRSALYSASPSR